MKGKPMPIDLDAFKPAYKKWVEESLPDYRAGNMKEIVKKYPLIAPDDIPWTPYNGEPSNFREIPKTVRQADIGVAHAHYDHGLAEQDINIVFPIERLVELENEGIIGKLADTHYSFSYVNDAVSLVEETVPKFISRIKAAGVDALLLVPLAGAGLTEMSSDRGSDSTSGRRGGNSHYLYGQFRRPHG
jgi:hypothetical protein